MTDFSSPFAVLFVRQIMNDDPGEIEDVSWRSWALIGAFSVTLGALSWSTLEFTRARDRERASRIAARDAWLTSAKALGFAVYEEPDGPHVDLDSQAEISAILQTPSTPLPAVTISTSCLLKLPDKVAIEQRFPFARVICEDGTPYK